MNSITYKLLKNTDITVYLDGKKVGTIIQLSTGFGYCPKGQSIGKAIIYPSLKECKQSIEGDD